MVKNYILQKYNLPEFIDHPLYCILYPFHYKKVFEKSALFIYMISFKNVVAKV